MNRLGILFFFVSSWAASAATYTAASINYTDIQAAVNAEAAANPLSTGGNWGADTVIIPAGVSTWPNGGGYVLVTNPITLQFPGTNVGSYINFNNTVNGSPSWKVAAIALFTTNTTAIGTNQWRITGLELHGLQTTGGNFKGVIQFLGNGYSVRFDHNYMTNCNDWYVTTYGVCGVADHNTFCIPNNNFAFEFTAENWSGIPNGTGPVNATFADGSWNAATSLGTSNFFFVEYNRIFYTGVNASFAFDATAGGRLVFRHNYTSNEVYSMHGTETGALIRGPRAFEIYDNTNVQSIANDHPINVRGGTGVIFSNEVIYNTGGSFNPFYTEVDSYGCAGMYPDWGAFNGTNSLCINASNSIGVSTVFATFGATNTSVPSPASSPFWYTIYVTNTDGTTPNWTVNQWRGYSIVDTTLPGGTPPTQGSCSNFSLVSYNGSHSISFVANSTGANISTGLPGAGSPIQNIFNAGDVLKLYLQTNVLDMPGMGQCTGWVRDPNSTLITNNAITLNQQIEPIYSWSNTINGTPVGTTNVFSVVKSNVQFIDFTPMPGYTPYTDPHPLTQTESAPLFVTQPPASQTLSSGSAFSITAVATGNPTPTYQWSFNSSPISGATSTTYSISSITSGNAGTYYCVASSGAGTAQSSNSVLIVSSSSTPPTISSQPASTNVWVNSSASFSVTASGTSPLSYTWEYNGKVVAGYTSSIYTLSSVVLGLQGAYTCTISNTAGSITSSIASLGIITASTIQGDATGQNVIVGGPGGTILAGGFLVTTNF